MLEELDKTADEIIIQEFSYQEKKYRTRHDLSNVIARYNIESEVQTIISCHWDTRPWSDSEPSRKDRNQPIIGANDGGSGVAVLA